MLFIFDLDGTLIDSRADLTTAANLVRRHYGLPALPGETVAGYVGDGIRVLMERALAGTGADIDTAVQLQEKFYSEHLVDDTVLYPDVADGLRRLFGAGHALAVASNKPVVFSEKILRHFGLREMLVHVAGDGNAAPLKPHPAMIVDTMRRAGIEAAQTWMVGDHHTDLEAARHAGCRSVFLADGIGRQGTETPDIVCASFAEFVGRFAPQS